MPSAKDITSDVRLSSTRASVRTRDGPRRLCGPSPPLSLFDSLEGPTQYADVLFLSADPWHLLASLANRPSDGLVLVRAVLAYKDFWCAARTMLLLYLTGTLRADNGG